MQRRSVLGLSLVLSGLGLSAAAWAVDTAKLAGDWLAPAEDADDVDAVITLALRGSSWTGTIKTIRVTRTDQKLRDDSLCTLCKGPQHGNPLKGMTILWDLRDGPDALSGGKILDPGDGALYDCEMRLSADGKTLKVLAYKGAKFLGHTMTWERL